jgi:hypothetical protein
MRMENVNDGQVDAWMADATAERNLKRFQCTLTRSKTAILLLSDNGIVVITRRTIARRRTRRTKFGSLPTCLDASCRVSWCVHYVLLRGGIGRRSNSRDD